MVHLHVMDELYSIMAASGVALKQYEPSVEQVPNSVVS